MRALAGLLLLGLLLAPPSAAQTPTSSVSVGVDDPARALPPGQPAELSVRLTYSYTQYAQPAPDPSTENKVASTRIALEVVQKPSWVADARVDPPVVLVEPSPLRNQIAVPGVRVLLNVSPDAPALQREVIVVRAVAEPNGAIPGSQGESPELKLRAALVAKVRVVPETPSPFVIEGGAWAVVPFRVENLGNDDAIVALNVTTRPERSEVRFPTETRIPRNGTARVDVEIRTPWTERETGTLVLEALPVVEEGEAPAARGEVDVVGESAAPGPSPAWVVAGVLGLAAARASRRRR